MLKEEELKEEMHYLYQMQCPRGQAGGRWGVRNQGTTIEPAIRMALAPSGQN